MAHRVLSRALSRHLPSRTNCFISHLQSRTAMTTKITEWADKKTGEFIRKDSAFRNTVSRDPGAQFAAERGRYHLFVSYACPWAHRTLLVRRLKGLDSIIGVSVVHWHLGKEGWRFGTPEESSASPEIASQPEALTGAHFLRDVYFAANPSYDGRYTVPTFWDTKLKTICNNESSEIIRFLYTEFDDLIDAQFRGVTYYPEGLREQIDTLNAWVYDAVNNGVYKAGFATSQEAYDHNVEAVFAGLDKIETLLQGSKGKYLLGDTLTEADIRLYPTIVRFDPVYVQHFKCNIKTIRHDYPAIHKWLRHLYWDIPAFKETTNFEHIKKHYTKSHTQINPHGITPVGPVPDILPKDE